MRTQRGKQRGGPTGGAAPCPGQAVGKHARCSAFCPVASTLRCSSLPNLPAAPQKLQDAEPSTPKLHHPVSPFGRVPPAQQQQQQQHPQPQQQQQQPHQQHPQHQQQPQQQDDGVPPDSIMSRVLALRQRLAAAEREKQALQQELAAAQAAGPAPAAERPPPSTGAERQREALRQANASLKQEAAAARRECERLRQSLLAAQQQASAAEQAAAGARQDAVAAQTEAATARQEVPPPPPPAAVDRTLQTLELAWQIRGFNIHIPGTGQLWLEQCLELVRLAASVPPGYGVTVQQARQGLLG